MQQKSPEDKKKISEETTKLLDAKYNKGWMKIVDKKLPWPAYNNENIKKHVEERFKYAMSFIATAKVLSRPEQPFTLCGDQGSVDNFDPIENPNHKKLAQHILTMAEIASKRTDDPKKGVGAVILSSKMEILSLGWNGFPQKALYGEYSRGNVDEDSKYPYVIHAEQNAFLMRNKKNIQDSILFVTKTPCDECAPLIKIEGVKTVVVNDDVMESKGKPGQITYDLFKEMVKRKKITCYHKTKHTQQENGQQNIGSEKNTRQKNTPQKNAPQKVQNRSSFKKIAIFTAPLMMSAYLFLKKVR